MPASRRPTLLIACATLLLGCAHASEVVELRGYGTVGAEFAPAKAVFTCESAAKADILLGKLLADLFWDAGAGHVERTVALDGRDVLVHAWPPYGALIAGRDGATVLALGGRDEAGVLAAARQDPRCRSATFAAKPSKPYPLYLDFFDLRAWKSETRGLASSNGFRNDERMRFIGAYCTGGMMGHILFRDGAAPGVNAAISSLDTDLVCAEQAKQLYAVSIGTGIWPLWARNRWPQLLDNDSEHSPASVFHGGFFGPAESLGIRAEEQRRAGLGFLMDLMRRYKDRDAFGGWELYCGDYIYETYFAKDRQGHLGYTPAGQEAFRRWLRGAGGYSLAALGERWHGDPARFKDWSDVRLPEDLNGFYGNLDADCLRIDRDWQWMKAGQDLETAPDDADPGWMLVGDPSSRVASLTANPSAQPAWWRVAFDAAAWLKRHPGTDAYLVCNLNNPGWRTYRISLNGTAMGPFTSTVSSYDGPISVKVTGRLAAGANRLTLSTPGGQIRGPVFLTASEPRAYPYLGKQQNARYADMLQWQLAALNGLVEDTMAYGRHADPDRPYIDCATSLAVRDGQGVSLARHGGSMQDTGYESSFRPFNSRLGFAAGFYGSCEPGGFIPTRGAGNLPETKMLGWMQFNAEGHFRMTGDTASLDAIERESGWLARNRRGIELIGKYLPARPGIAILASSRAALLGDENHFAEWNIGRGELHACHFDNVYVTETMLAQGLADPYPVLFDSDSMFMDRETIAAIRAYVEQGGTFVALHQSGRHGIVEADAWPISELTGFKVRSIGQHGKIRFAKQLALFTGWEGREFDGEGSSVNWKDEETAHGVSTALEPVAAEAVSLARWDDGSTAVGLRRLGKGRVIVLGSTFWRSARDQGGTGIWKIEEPQQTFMDTLFAGLGVARSATASDKRVFARKATTKNGLQDWLIALNSIGVEITADAGCAVAERPEQVWDLADGKPVPFTYDHGWVTVPALAIPAHQTRILGMKRADLAGGLDVWWREKTTFWKRSAPVPIPESDPVDPANPPAIGFDAWRFLADRDGTLGKAADWAKPAFADASWRDHDNTPWNFRFDDLAAYAGVGLYRSRPFNLPAGWKGRRISLDFQAGGCFAGIEFLLNGERLAGFPQPRRKLDITDRLRRDGNVLAIRLTGTRPVSGLLGCAVWIQPELRLSPAISLLGPWEAVMCERRRSEPATLAGLDRAATDEGVLRDQQRQRIEDEAAVRGRHLAVKAAWLAREVEVPAAWKGKAIYIRVSSPQMIGQKLPLCGLTGGMLVVNGQPIAFVARPNTPIEDEAINVTALLRPGQKNRIELWPRLATLGGATESLIVVNELEMGCAVE